MENIVCDIENEVYEFLFEGKKAQLSLFDANGNSNDLVFVDDANGGSESDMFPEVNDPEDETADM